MKVRSDDVTYIYREKRELVREISSVKGIL
jgi:hypothetical protein